MITGDALHTQHAHGTYLRERGAHYLAIVKKNHPACMPRPGSFHGPRSRSTTPPASRPTPRRDPPAQGRQVPAPRLSRWRRRLSTGKLTIERVPVITSLDIFGATPAQLAAWIRGHWGFENLLHHVRDHSARTTPRSAPGACPAPWPACATSPSASSGRTATPTSPPPSATPAANQRTLTALGLT
ncbi:transposase [Streptomyces sp. NPDC058286]|uniref:transposase n=1 Tax=Streptomyces sp. NPDC058286 TaxID=3346422 RepID=UPI0036E894D0